MIIRNLADLCNWAGAEFPRSLNKAIYKGTDCGASISVLLKHAPKCAPCRNYLADYRCGANVGTGECDCPHCQGFCTCHRLAWIHCGDPRWNELPADTVIDGFTVQTIVEGSDATVDSDTFYVPIDSRLVDDWIEEMEAEADRLWKDANEDEEDEA